MRAAFKEWAVVVDALGSGGQIIILRKGGISEGREGFKPEHSRFFLFPTQFHQQRDEVIPSAQARYDLIAPAFRSDDRVRLEFFADIVVAERLHSLEEAEALRGQHIWRDEVIAERFEWGGERAIYALVVRVFKLPAALEMPILASYGGCKSWIELEQDYDVGGSCPVLDNGVFEKKLGQFLETLRHNESARLLVKAALKQSGV